MFHTLFPLRPLASISTIAEIPSMFKLPCIHIFHPSISTTFTTKEHTLSHTITFGLHHKGSNALCNGDFYCSKFSRSLSLLRFCTVNVYRRRKSPSSYSLLSYTIVHIFHPNIQRSALILLKLALNVQHGFEQLPPPCSDRLRHRQAERRRALQDQATSRSW